MGLWNASDQMGEAIQEKRKLDEMRKAAAEKAKAEVAEEEKRHKESEEEGMI